MIPTGGTVEAISRLTLTWDVLKYQGDTVWKTKQSD